MLGEEALDAIREGLDSIERFRTDFAGHADEFLPFLSEHLLGLPPDILSGADRPRRGHAERAREARRRRRSHPRASRWRTRPPRSTAALDALDPAVAAGYASIARRSTPSTTR